MLVYFGNSLFDDVLHLEIVLANGSVVIFEKESSNSLFDALKIVSPRHVLSW